MPDRSPTDPSGTGGVEAVRRRVLAGHRDVLATVLDCADGVAATLPTPTTDGRRLAATLETELVDASALERFPAILATAVDALGVALPADPVAAPPYVAVTSRGPLCRATTERGRIVLLVAVFDVRRDCRTETSGADDGPTENGQSPAVDGPRYVRNDRAPDGALDVSLVERSRRSDVGAAERERRRNGD